MYVLSVGKALCHAVENVDLLQARYFPVLTFPYRSMYDRASQAERH
jgi:hypothetical protein